MIIFMIPPGQGWPNTVCCRKQVGNKQTFTLIWMLLFWGCMPEKNNPELAAAHALGLPVLSFPEFVFRESADKTRAAICGSHGKTTITAMVMHVLLQQEKDFDYLVGAQLEGFEVMVRLSEAPWIILEGDEYLASPIDRRPKFVHYQPQIALLSGIAWDHINVFPTYDSYLDAFRGLAAGQQEEDVFIYNAEDREVEKILDAAKGKKVPYQCPDYRVENGQMIVTTRAGQTLPMQCIGRHNLLNAAGAAAVCAALGINYERAWEALSSFPGASRRLEVIGRNDSQTVIRDFAHSPSKVTASANAVAEQFGEKGFTACLELHTFSSLDSRFLPQYKDSLNAAERAILFYNPETVAAKKLPPVSAEQIKLAFNRKDLEVISDPAELRTALLTSPVPQQLLLMSSGPMGGINLQELTGEILGA